MTPWCHTAIRLASAIALSALAAAIAGCAAVSSVSAPSSSAAVESSSRTLSPPPPRRSASLVAHVPKTKLPTTASGWDARACQDFQTFYLDLETDTPHAVNVLMPAAQEVLHDVIQAAPDGSRRLFNNANDLVAYVGSSAWLTQGNVLSAPVQRMVNDCPPG
jgi:hypothetical protein